MLCTQGGAIVNISSTASLRAYSPAASYGPSKAAVNNMSYNMAVEYGPQQVRVNCILPALIETELAHTRVKPGEDWYEDYEKPAIGALPAPHYPAGPRTTACTPRGRS